MRLLLTCGSPETARALCSALARLWPPGFSARLLLPPGFDPPDLPPGVEAITGAAQDYDAAALKVALAGVEAVIHADPLPALPAYRPGETARPLPDAVDRATRGTYHLLCAMRAAGVRRLVLCSSLQLFARFPDSFRVTEAWRPRAAPHVLHLPPWLAELSVREACRDGAVRAVCLRLGPLLPTDTKLPPKPGELHREDAARAVLLALERLRDGEGRAWWEVFHIAAGGEGQPCSEAAEKKLGFVAARAGQQPPSPRPESGQEGRQPGEEGEGPGPEWWRWYVAPTDFVPPRPVRNVVVFGAGGPVGAAVAEEMRTSYRLRLTDARPLDEIAGENSPQSPGAPVARPLGPPHEDRVTDVRDPDAVAAACEGMDAIINLTVVRPDPVEAFRVNTLGAYNIARAAVAHRIRRLVQTGPELVEHAGWDAYEHDYDVPGDAPPRPGVNLYFHSKYLGQEILRVFADNHEVETPVLLFCQFCSPDAVTGLHPFAVSWQDAARAIRRAVEVESFPSPYEVMNVCADLPHGRYDNARARRLLGWEPRDDLSEFWAAR